MLDQDVANGHTQELRRGTVVLACLMVLRKPEYGYALLETLDSLGFPVDANTLYPLLRRLEKQGLLSSDWNTDQARPRKFYRTSDTGRELADLLLADWSDIQSSIHKLHEGDTA
jgi:DNA-binding PadR family transcriptional regulator